jgi:hypothetical protein
MAEREKPAAASKAAPLPEFIAVEPFLNLGSTRWWQFTDRNTHQSSRWECTEPAPGRFELKARLGKKLIEHVVKAEPDATQTTRQFTFVQSKMDGQVTTWVGGLVVPAPWKVGQSVSATSETGANPATGHPIELTLRLIKHDEAYKPPDDAAFPPDLRLNVIELELTGRDVGLGTPLLKSQQVFALGIGIIEAIGQNFGDYYVLKFDGWSGGR